MMCNQVVCISGLLFLAYVVLFASLVAFYHATMRDPPFVWLLVFAPLIGVLWLMVWVLCPSLFCDSEKRR